MARNLRQKSGSSDSNRRLGSRSTRRPAPSSRASSRSVAASRSARLNRSASVPVGRVHATGGRSIADISKQADRAERDKRRAQSMQRAAKATRRPLLIAGIVIGAIIAVLLALFVVSRTDAFTIEEVTFTGADHLTYEEATALVSIPAGTTLLNVDAGSIEASLMRDSWVQGVEVKRVFPSTLEVVVTEREVAAIVEIPMGTKQTIQNWAISPEGIWIMAIPNKDSEVGQKISPRIYEDVENVIHITGVEVGLVPEMGTECTDANVNNALKIITGLTTELADQIKSVTAADPDSTVVTLKNNIEISFGRADNIREKERVCLDIMKNNPTVVKINVRVVERPTWKLVGSS